ncbi:KxYKxGKxW signal peptide domain-containing protein [Levilactobacillus suantsaii]|uniref:KxYKxGKxW signal peptide domain-containing protein n=1 Tax=Levilactobacillus suantsaii TaxID=2292255 RepID=UPI0015F5C6BB|nr:KxYKxGKxW signal peptide domain-containing protein [Levilactobacillus suantsaii]QMU09168.1 KxYKxGKxW signal peptide domain-containing protein [Levilactobacillus suantsaii]
MFETKVHFKLYKAGKKWLVAAIGVTTLGIGLSQTTIANADSTSSSSDAATTAVSDQSSATQNKVVPLKATKSTTEKPVTTNGDAVTSTKDSAANTTNVQNSSATTTEKADLNVNSAANAAANSGATTNVGTSSSSTPNDDALTNTNKANDVNNDTTANNTTNDVANDGTTNDNDATDVATDKTADDAITTHNIQTEDSIVVPTATPASTQTTYDPTQETTEPAIVNNASGHDVQPDDDVQVHVRLTGTDAQGNTSTSLTETNGLKSDQAASIIDSRIADLSAIFNITNTTDQAQNINFLFMLPSYADSASSRAAQVTLADGTPASDFLADLPDGVNLTFMLRGGGMSYSYADLLAAGYSLADVEEMRFQGTLAANAAYVAKVPLTITDPQLYSTNLEQIDLMNYTAGTSGALYFRIAAPAPDKIVGQYYAVAAGQISLHNFGPGDDTYSGSTLYTGGLIDVNLTKANIDDLVKDYGYSVLLNKDGTPQTDYTYRLTPTGVQVNGDSGTTGDGTSSTLAPYIYITLRKVITTQDSALTVGQDWTAADNFVSGLDDNDDPLNLDQVQVSISDPDNILQDSKATKAGTFKVTYAYQVADDYNNTGDPYIVAETATINVTDPNQGTTTGGGTTTTPDNTGDNTGTSTNNSDDTTTTGDNPTTGNAGDTVTTGDAGDTVTTNDTDDSTTPSISTGEAGDTIITGNASDKLATPQSTTQATTKNARATQLKRGGNADQIVTGNTETSTTTRHATVTGAYTPTGTATATATPATTTSNAAQPTMLAHTTTQANTVNTQKTGQATNTATIGLPQTNETKSTGFIAAGMALLLGAFGMATDRRKQH